MKIDRRLLLTLLTGALAGPAAAQPNGPGSTGKPVPQPGSGAGYHDPRSQFPPLKEREGVVSWNLLSSVTTRVEGAFVRPVYPKAVQALNNREVMVQGFMMPLEPGKQQKHFLLSAVPTTCSFCTPAGPEGLIEVKSKGPVTFSQEAVTVRGKMSVLPSDPYGMFYRLADGQLVK
jgi:hypothetical protein